MLPVLGQIDQKKKYNYFNSKISATDLFLDSFPDDC